MNIDIQLCSNKREHTKNISCHFKQAGKAVEEEEEKLNKKWERKS
jgi:hypothetical protein